jgi:hypothetical protein
MMFLSSWSASAQTQAKKSKEEIAKMAVEKELTKAGFSENDIEEIKNRIDGVTNVEISGHPDKMESLTSDGKETFYIVEAMPKFDGGNLETFRNWVQTKVSILKLPRAMESREPSLSPSSSKMMALSVIFLSCGV